MTSNFEEKCNYISLDYSVRDVLQWAKHRNIINGATDQSQCLKLMSELGELADAILKRQSDKIKDGIGDCLVVLTIIAAQNGTSLGECVAHAYDEIKDRRGIMFNGTFVKESDSAYASVIARIEQTET